MSFQQKLKHELKSILLVTLFFAAWLRVLMALKQEGPWTYGGLENHLWSYESNDARADVNGAFI